MKRYQILIFTSLIIGLNSCERVKYFPDNPIVNNNTFILAHKGGGTFDNGNTLEGCMYGLELLDGIECDIQKSSNNTLWLSHSPLIPSCGSFEEGCFPEISDNTIIQMDSCLGVEENYTQLEDVFQYMSNNYPDKFISLDVKAWKPCKISGVNMIKEMNMLARKIIDLTKKYHLENNVMVESENGDFLYYIKTNTNFIETYLSTFGDFEMGVSRALGAEFSGISYDFKFKANISKEQVDLIHRKGLKIQLWTVNDTNDIKEALSLKPDFIQTDFLEYEIWTKTSDF